MLPEYVHCHLAAGEPRTEAAGCVAKQWLYCSGYEQTLLYHPRLGSEYSHDVLAIHGSTSTSASRDTCLRWVSSIPGRTYQLCHRPYRLYRRLQRDRATPMPVPVLPSLKSIARASVPIPRDRLLKSRTVRPC